MDKRYFEIRINNVVVGNYDDINTAIKEAKKLINDTEYYNKEIDIFKCEQEFIQTISFKSKK